MINKQTTGFKFGQHRLVVLKQIGEIVHGGRTYRLVEVRTNEGQVYWSWRLYGKTGHFIKQFLFEPVLAPQMATLLIGRRDS